MISDERLDTIADDHCPAEIDELVAEVRQRRAEAAVGRIKVTTSDKSTTYMPRKADIGDVWRLLDDVRQPGETAPAAIARIKAERDELRAEMSPIPADIAEAYGWLQNVWLSLDDVRRPGETVPAAVARLIDEREALRERAERAERERNAALAWIGRGHCLEMAPRYPHYVHPDEVATSKLVELGRVVIGLDAASAVEETPP